MTKLEELSAKIAEAKEAYYNSGTSPLTDQEYDRLVEKASRLGYIDYVGSKPATSIPTITHDHLMLSLDKVHSVGEIKKFADGKDIIMMLKMDGLSVSATYIDGVLVRLETRGDGEIGNDILFHANSFENLPKVINKSGKYVIDGECVIKQKDFDSLNSDYSNPRNLASGSLNQLNPAISAQRHLRFVVWDVIEGGSSGYSHKNLDEASELGFDVVPYLIGEDTKDYMMETSLERIREVAERLSYPIDGCVIRYDDIDYGRSLGVTGHHPRHSCAYKYEDESYPTKLIDVIWQLGKSGQLTPVATFKPVDMSGVVVERASLHNISVMKSLELTHGCTVYVCRANDVIPQIVSADYDGDGEIKIPSECPECHGETKVVKQNDSEVLYCTNPNCKGRVLSRLEYFVGKSGLDINGLSEKTLGILYNLGVVRKFSDIFMLYEHREILENIPGLGKRSVDKLLSAIKASSQNVDLPHFISALSIPGVGLSQAKLLAKAFGTWKAFEEAAVSGSYDFTQLGGVGDVTARSIVDYFHSESFDRGLDSFIVFADVRSTRASADTGESDSGDSPISGKTFVITGKLHSGKRDDLVAKIETLGGHVAGSVSKNTDYLINNDSQSTSSKNVKAKQLGVEIITEDEFLAML